MIQLPKPPPLDSLEASERARELSYRLIRSFVWQDTPQGSDYWYEVWQSLQCVRYPYCFAGIPESSFNG